MTTAATTTTAAAAGGRSTYHPPYEEMILTAIETHRNGLPTQAISNYITRNYSNLPPTHSTLLSHHLDQLISKGAIKKLKLFYKLVPGGKKPEQPETAVAPVERKKRGRPPKLLPLAAPAKKRKPGRPPKLLPLAAPVKKRKPGRTPKLLPLAAPVKKRKPGRPPKLLPLVATVKKRKPGRPVKPAAAPIYPASIHIIPQDTDLHSDILQRFPGAAAIVLPKSLLIEKTGKNSIIIFPNVIQSLIEASSGKGKKVGRPHNVDVAKRRPGRPRKSDLVMNGGGNSGAKGPGRPWKIRDMLAPGITRAAAFETGKKVVELGISKGVDGMEESSRSNKRKSAGRPRKRPLIEGYPPAI